MRTFITIVLLTLALPCVVSAQSIVQSQIQTLQSASPSAISSKGLDGTGIELVDFMSPSFAQIAAAGLPDKPAQETLNLLPYAVVLRNHTQRTIILYAIKWTFTDGSGKMTRTIGTEMSTHSSVGGRAISPGENRLLGIVRGFQGNTRVDQDRISQYWAQNSAYYRRQKTVKISLDTIAFGDGQIIGPDESRAGMLAMARVNSERDVVNQIRDIMSREVPVNALLTTLTAIQREGQPLLLTADADPLSAATFQKAARKADSYQTSYGLMKASYATVLLSLVHSQGSDVLVQRLLNHVDSLPNLHR